jgi:hypothetical protein
MDQREYIIIFSTDKISETLINYFLQQKFGIDFWGSYSLSLRLTTFFTFVPARGQSGTDIPLIYVNSSLIQVWMKEHKYIT